MFYTIGTIFSITVPIGNYNAFQLISTMTQLFLENGHSISMVISRINGKLTYTGTTNFTFNSSGSTILRVLGFLTSINASSVSNVLVSPFPLNLIGIKRITLTSANLATIALHTQTGKTSTQSILGTVIVDKPSFGLITHSGVSNVNHLLKVKVIDKIDLQITDEDGNFIDFQNQDFTMKLKISSTYYIEQESNTTFKGLTQQIQPQPKQKEEEIEETNKPIVFSPDSDLDTLLYNLKKPIQPEIK